MKLCLAADLVIDSFAVGTSLSKASGLSVTALNSSTSSGGAQLTDYSLTTAAVDTNSIALSGSSYDSAVQRVKEVTAKPSESCSALLSLLPLPC